MTETERANAADKEASQWHQGSGTHTGGCAALAEEHEELAAKGGKKAKKHQEAAKLWADAAEAEAKELRKSHGEWSDDEDDWKAGPSGKATKKAKKASKALGLKTDEYW
jgi:hypothetical protein